MGLSSADAQAGINRYIVGCKLTTSNGSSMTSALELIDTQWDVNIGNLTSQMFANIELIDTQWDVNILITQKHQAHPLELIDTQWDVNYHCWWR